MGAPDGSWKWVPVSFKNYCRCVVGDLSFQTKSSFFNASNRPNIETKLMVKIPMILIRISSTHSLCCVRGQFVQVAISIMFTSKLIEPRFSVSSDRLHKFPTSEVLSDFYKLHEMCPSMVSFLTSISTRLQGTWSERGEFGRQLYTHTKTQYGQYQYGTVLFQMAFTSTAFVRVVPRLHLSFHHK
ncbi:hypothetical protein VNO77_05620 [Canavalia gladiata]|uniref:Uncharacterized protein n=1 Tax=Canavalia gladiata TaxID=3824 RepID=A0AAN9N0R8_CANGL